MKLVGNALAIAFSIAVVVVVIGMLLLYGDEI